MQETYIIKTTGRHRGNVVVRAGELGVDPSEAMRFPDRASAQRYIATQLGFGKTYAVAPLREPRS